MFNFMGRRNFLMVFLLIFLVVNTIIFAVVYRQSLAPSDSGAAGLAKSVLTLTSPATVEGINTTTNINVGFSLQNTTGVSAAEIVLNYDPTKLTGVSITEATGVLALNKNFNSTTGKITVDIAKEGSGTFTANSTLVTFTFTRVGTTSKSTTVTVDPTSTFGIPNQAATDGYGSLTLNFIVFRCGDGSVQTPNDSGFNEQCDAGAQNGVTCTAAYGSTCTYCTSTCTVQTVQGAKCGDGTTQTANGETCDAGAQNGVTCTAAYGSTCTYCNSTCQTTTVTGPRCGDGTTQTGNGEQCDNGAQNGTACSPAYGTSCTYCNSTCQNTTVQGAKCGDGVVNVGSETCDDGNLDNYDSCGSTCQISCSADQVAIAGKCVSVSCRGDYDRDGTILVNDFGTFGNSYKKGVISCNLDIVIENSTCELNLVDFARFAQQYKVANACK